MGRKKIALPDSLTEFSRFYLHPEILKDMRIAQLRGDIPSLSELLHEILCEALEREDLTLRPAAHAESR